MILKLFFIAFLYFIFALLISGEDQPESPIPEPPTPIEEALYLHRYPQSYEKIGADSSIKIIRPTFFVYLRNLTYTREEGFRDKILAMVQIANIARSKEYMYDSEHLDPWVENIVIIEEDNYWVVTFHSRGNEEIVREAEGINDFPVLAPPPKSYYLSKGQLELIEKPEGSLKPVMPGISYGHIEIKHVGYFEVSTNYPDDNVDSFMTIEEAIRRNREVWLKETGQLEDDKSQTED